MITARSVALRAGVSVSAVSRAFRPNSSLAPDKHERILAAARELGYVTPSGRSAAALASGVVTLVAGDLANPFYPMVVERLAQTVQESGRQLVVHALAPDESVDSVTARVLAIRSDAVIVTSAQLSWHSLAPAESRASRRSCSTGSSPMPG